MSYSIIQKSLDIYHLVFHFKNSIAIVTVENIGGNRLLLKSETDGYHFFTFWLSQDPNIDAVVFEQELLENEELKSINSEKVRRLWQSKNLIFTPKNEESFYINYGYGRDFGESLMKMFAKIIEPRFALFEKSVLASPIEM